MTLNKNKKYIVGVSGGPDSIFLLSKLILKGYKNLIVCHINHNFRKEALLDQKVVEDICKKNNTKLVIKNIYYEKKFGNFESWARNERYKIFSSLLKENKFDSILTGHNQNDVVETFIMQLEKKSLVKYYGISYSSNLFGCNILRPILNYKKTYIINWLNKRNIDYAIDKTNLDIKYKRNKIRANLKEKEIKHFIKEINQKNKSLSKKYKTINNLLDKSSSYLNINYLKLNDDDFNLRLIYEFLVINNLQSHVLSTKKAKVKEILKQIRSKKNYLTYDFDNRILLKDYNKIYICDKSIVSTFETNNKPNNCTYINAEISNLVYTNNWIKWQSKLYYKNKKLKTHFMNKKVSYLERFKIILVFEPEQKVILNKLW
ncbi:tRNA(Ile)-lysidine synthase [Spiroplasma corruscae]|uniref:tRNA(Ile)-lysidine synthase n=1 Tax=Spiroplasma corruscae TaxID=216934 RepID=A0A222EMP1_9MOLU|nr:tRNA lysidine(34) synthetase TilS [Spiroplasma corruscae]ASP27786.1 tRNA(Ile)-lysidine synthase [Spiroplasma corruscae]